MTWQRRTATPGHGTESDFTPAARAATSTRGRSGYAGRRPSFSRRAGLSLMEMLVSLSIVAVLLTATVTALDASFYAYAAAAESASTHTSARLISHRLLTLIRTSTAHGPLEGALPTDADFNAMVAELNTELAAAGRPTVTLPAPLPAAGQGVGPTVFESSFIRLLDDNGDDMLVVYLGDPWLGENETQSPDVEELWVVWMDAEDSTNVMAQPLIGGVTHARFTTRRRLDASGVPVLERGSMIVEIEPSRDTSLSLEASNTQPVQIIASTTPRKLLPR